MDVHQSHYRVWGEEQMKTELALAGGLAVAAVYLGSKLIPNLDALFKNAYTGVIGGTKAIQEGARHTTETLKQFVPTVDLGINTQDLSVPTGDGFLLSPLTFRPYIPPPTQQTTTQQTTTQQTTTQQTTPAAKRLLAQQSFAKTLTE